MTMISLLYIASVLFNVIYMTYITSDYVPENERIHIANACMLFVYFLSGPLVFFHLIRKHRGE